MSNRTDKLARWERTERAIAAFLAVVQESRERNARAVAEHLSAIDYRRERGLEGYHVERNR